MQPQDKAKIGNLIRKVVELDTERKSTQQKAKEQTNKLKKQVTALKSQNNAIIKQHTKLRSKFQQSLKLLQNYQIKLNQMDKFYQSQAKEFQSQSQKQNKDNISAKIEHEKYAKQIQDEITELKQLILDLHEKEKEKLEQLAQQKKIEEEEEEKRQQIQTQLREKEREKENISIPSNYLRASRRSMIYDANNPLLDDDEDILQDLSPIKTPKSNHRPPKPHPYPHGHSHSRHKQLSLAQLRKYTWPNSNNSSSTTSLNTRNLNTNPNHIINPIEATVNAIIQTSQIQEQANCNKNTSRPIKLNRDRLNQLLRIQSGDFKNKNEDRIIRKNPSNGWIKNELSKPLKMNINENLLNVPVNGHMNDYVDTDEDDRLSVYENINVGLHFPDTDEDASDEEDESLLIEALNVIPQQ